MRSAQSNECKERTVNGLFSPRGGADSQLSPLVPSGSSTQRTAQGPPSMEQWNTHVCLYGREPTEHRLVSGAFVAQECMKDQVHGQNKWELNMFKMYLSHPSETQNKGHRDSCSYTLLSLLQHNCFIWNTVKLFK